MAMHNPAHPGEILREDVLKPLGLSITSAAESLGISRKTLSKIVNERGTITAEMAMRLELTLGKPKAEQWLRLQTAYDLFHVRSHKAELLNEIHALAA
ncbi:HigA family addiction module antidote protein [Mariprofundus ferrooxydans]|nr:HigA family addiction module antidote protein [Mariprofundus ferrooxydans]